MSEPNRILIIRPSALGDVCRSTPVLASLRNAYPDATIDWLVRDVFTDAISAHPALNEVVPFARRDLARSMSRVNLAPTMRWLRSLKDRRYDLVIDAQGLARSGLFTWATRAKHRVGDGAAREGAWLCYNQRVDLPMAIHTVDRMLALVEAIGVDVVRDMRLYAPEVDRAGVAGDPRLNLAEHVVLAPTSIWPGKRWPIDRFARVAQRLIEADAGPIVVVGAEGEQDQCAQLTSIEGVIDLVGRTSIGRLMAVIERSRLVIANDSASLHMAVGFDKPIVALFGPTRTDLVGPYQRDHDVIQHLEPGDVINHKNDVAGRTIMERITVEEVLAAALQRLA